MPDLHVYEYAVIRLVPKVEREEFLNIGVILFCRRKRFLGVRYQLNPDRLACFAAIPEFEQLQSYLETWRLIAAGKPEGGPNAQLDQASRFRWLAAPRSTIIQPSPIHVGRCTEPSEVLEGLFYKYVG